MFWRNSERNKRSSEDVLEESERNKRSSEDVLEESERNKRSSEDPDDLKHDVKPSVFRKSSSGDILMLI